MSISKEKLNKLVKEICGILGLGVPYAIFRLDEKIMSMPDEKIKISIKLIEDFLNENKD